MHRNILFLQLGDLISIAIGYVHCLEVFDDRRHRNQAAEVGALLVERDLVAATAVPLSDAERASLRAWRASFCVAKPPFH